MNNWEKYNIDVNDWDRLLSLKFIENCNPGSTFCDVGACNGIMTSLFKSIAGENGMVYSFELNLFNYQVLKKLESSNCIVENLAVAEKSTMVDVFGDSLNSSNFTSNILGYDTSHRKMNKISEIKSVSLDEYFKNIDLDYLKIDVEGAEIQVMKGARKTLKKCKFVVIECHFQEDWKDIFDFLKTENLEAKNLVDDKPVEYKQTTQVPGLVGSMGMPYQIYFVR